MAKLAQGGFSIKKLIDGKTLSFSLSANYLTQFTQLGSTQYTPDFTTPATRLVITPNLSVSGMSGNQMSGQASWKINGTTTTTGVGTSSPFALTISNNLTSDNFYKIEASYLYTDPDTSKQTTVTASILITKQVMSANTIDAQIEFLNGDTFYTKNGVTENKSFRATLIRGAEPDYTQVTYIWKYYDTTTQEYVPIAFSSAGASGYLYQDAVYNSSTGQTTVTVASSGTNHRQLTINSGVVLNVQNYCVEIVDADSTSPTYNQHVYAYFSVKDQTDPYVLTAVMYNGDSVSSTSNAQVVFSVEQAGEVVAQSFYAGKTISFFRYNADGSVDKTFITNPTGASTAVSLPVADFTGWTYSTSTGYVSRAFTASSTISDRTVNFKYSHLKTGVASAGFGIILEG